MSAAQLVVLTLETQVAISAPYFSDHFDCFTESCECYARRTTGTSICLDRIPEPSRAESQFEATSAKQIDARSGLRHDSWWSQRQVRHIGEEPNARGLGSDHAEQREAIHKAPLVWMVLYRDVVQPKAFCLLRDREQ